MATLTVLKKKIAALEAQVERVTKAEIGGAIAKIRKLMDDYGVTVDHLLNGSKPGRSAASKKSVSGKVAKATKGKKPAKYMDPKSGATWSGLGRIPAWIANAKNRDAFLIEKATLEVRPAVPASKATAKRAPAKKVGKTRTVKSQPVKAAKNSPASKAAAPAKKSTSKTTRKTSASKKAVAPPQSAAGTDSAAA